MDPLTIAGLITGGVNAVKSLFGGKQLSDSQKALRKLKRPTYTRPQESNELLDLYRKRSAATQLPGQEAIESGLGATVAQGVSDVQNTASSSVSALGAITDLYGRKQQAVRDLGIQFAEYKAQRQGELGNALGQAAQYTDKEWEMNKLRPYEVRMNELMGNRQAGATNLFGGLEGMGAAWMNTAGTKAYLDILGKLGK